MDYWHTRCYFESKRKWLNVADDLEPASHYILNLDFSSYSLDTDNCNMRGYYIKVVKIKKKKMDMVVEVNDDHWFFILNKIKLNIYIC